jgi:putative endonuclease
VLGTKSLEVNFRAFLFMPYYVYILQSLKDGSYYKGYSENPFVRLQQHNAGESRYTSFKTPWKLVFIQSYDSKSAALIREKVLKKYSHSQIQQLLLSKLNELDR